MTTLTGIMGTVFKVYLPCPPDWGDVEKHPDGSWWFHYVADDGTAPPVRMVNFGPSKWRVEVGGYVIGVNEGPPLTPRRKRSKRT